MSPLFKYPTFSILLVLLVLFPCQGMAQSQMEMNQQALQDFDTADAELNAAYGTLISKLDEVGTAKLRDAQRAWVVFRDAEAIFYADGNRGGTMAPLVFNTSRTELTKKRTLQLQECIKEYSE